MRAYSINCSRAISHTLPDGRAFQEWFLLSKHTLLVEHAHTFSWAFAHLQLFMCTFWKHSRLGVNFCSLLHFHWKVSKRDMLTWSFNRVRKKGSMCTNANIQCIVDLYQGKTCTIQMCKHIFALRFTNLSFKLSYNIQTQIYIALLFSFPILGF